MPLTIEQQEILASVGRQPLLVSAGPGTGKTEVLSHSILQLLQSGLASKEEIIAIAFTTKAATSVRNRLEELGLPHDDQPLVCTLHSLSTRILRAMGSQIGVPVDFLIADDHESALTLKDAIIDIDPRAMKNVNTWGHKIRLLKAVGKGPEHLPDGFLKKLYNRYQKLLRFHSALDFHDLILRACELLATNVEAKAAYQRQAKHLLVDEFQDINKAEYHLIQLLAGNPEGLLAVGDDKQSIYGWRGGTPSIILGFCSDYPKAIMKPMTICFRCPEKIIRGADEFINRQPRLKPQQTDSEPIWILDCKSDVQEAKFICDWITNAIEHEEYLPNDIAVLYRGGDVADKVADALANANLPIERPSPEQTTYVREFLACLRLIIDRRDSLALRVCLASPLARRIGVVGIKKIREVAERKDISFWDALTIARVDKSFKRWHKPLNTFTDLIEDLSASISKDRLTTVLGKVAGALEYQNETKIIAIMKKSESMAGDRSLHEFVEDIRGLKGEKSADPRESGEGGDNAVLFVTTHSVKGLERKAIFVLGMEKGKFPKLNADMEEQKRLFYVAMTRAKKKLFLCYAMKREGRAAQGFAFYDKSPYILEIPKVYREFIIP